MLALPILLWKLNSPRNIHVLAEGILRDQESLVLRFPNLCPSFLLTSCFQKFITWLNRGFSLVFCPLKNNAKLIVFPKNSFFPANLCAELQNPILTLGRLCSFSRALTNVYLEDVVASVVHHVVERAHIWESSVREWSSAIPPCCDFGQVTSPHCATGIFFSLFKMRIIVSISAPNVSRVMPS